MASIAAAGWRLLRLTDSGELGAFGRRQVVITLVGAEHRIAAHQDGCRARHARAVPIARLDLAGGRAPGAGPPAAQPGLGDHRRSLRRRDGGDLRGQAQPQQRAAGDLGVPERGTLLVVPIDRAQQRVDVDEGPLLDAGQQRHARRQRHQMRAGYRGELVGVPEGELAQEDPQRGGRISS